MIRLKSLLTELPVATTTGANVFCAWCNEPLRYTAGLKPGETSHGICRKCAKAQFGITVEASLNEAVSVEEIWGDSVARDQYDFVLAAKDASGRKVGTVSVSDFRGVPAIKMIEVLPNMRRQGIGLELLRAVQKRYPTKRIQQQGNFATKEGQALWRAWKAK